MSTDHMTTVGPKCPYCGYQHIAGDDPEIHYDENMASHECFSCDREFNVRTQQSWIWWTFQKKEAK